MEQSVLFKRFRPLALLGLFFIVLPASVFPQAVVPDPADIAPVINPPNPQTNIVLSLADFMGGGVTTYQAFKNALTACRQQHAAKLIIPNGRYVFDDPQIPQAFVHVDLAGLSDLVVDGQGSELIFHYPVFGVHFDVSRRIVLRNLILDYDFQIASAGVAKKETNSTTSIHILDDYPINENTFIHIISPYDITNLRWKAAPGEIYDVQNLTLIRPQTIVSPAFNSLSDGEELVLVYYANQGHALAVFNSYPEISPTSDISLENITVYGAPGAGFRIAGGRGFHLSNCKIMPRPGAHRLISISADGAHFANTLGDILIEDCDFSGQADDSVNINAAWLRVTQQINARTVVLTHPFFDLISPGAVLRFVKPDSLAEYARRNVTQVTFDPGTGRYTVTVDQDLPANLAVNDLAINLTQSNHRFLIRRNYFHDHRARGMLISSQDGVIENNRVKDTTWQGMYLFTETAFFGEGPGAENVIVRNNTFDGCGYGDYGNVGEDMGCISLTVDVPQGISSAPVVKNILFEGNTISRTPGLALFISSASGVTVSNNVIINSNTLGAFPPFYGSFIGVTPHGSIMVTKASNVLLTNNLQLAGSQQVEKGIYVNSQDSTNVATQHNLEDPLPSNPLDSAKFFVRQHYLDFLSRYPDTDGWDYWNYQISQCGADATCNHNKRVDASNAFFYELEFQQTGSYVYRVYRAAFGNNQPFPNPDTSNDTERKKIPSYAVFASDRARVVGGANLTQGQLDFANAFVQRSEFVTKYPANLDGAAFIDAVLATIQNDLGIDLTLQKPALLTLFNQAGGSNAGRGVVMYRLANDDLVGGNGGINNRALIDAEYNRAFVATQYFGYLRRDADIGGLLFWLGQVSSAPLRDTSKQHAMVCSFITSAEYQLRFSPVVTHFNTECPQ
jgi:hypothetical protein